MTRLPKNLRYSEDREPGVMRKPYGDSYHYFFKNHRVKDPLILDRITALAIPPAYKNVWICADDIGHLQATGYDEKGRKQYRYHQDWTAFRSRLKYDNLEDFGSALPAIRRRIMQSLSSGYADKNFVCAALLRLVDKGALRAGSPENKATGATTLKRKHVRFNGDTLKLDFTAKGGKRVRKSIKDKTLSKTLQRIDDLPGRRLFQYIGRDNEIYGLDSADVNVFLRDDFTLKTFRTWHGSVAAFQAALQAPQPTVKSLCEAAASRLHNTPSICRSSYIHPAIIDLAKSGHDPNSYVDNKRAGLIKAERQMLSLIAR